MAERSKREKAAGRKKHRQMKRAKKMQREQKKNAELPKSIGKTKNSLFMRAQDYRKESLKIAVADRFLNAFHNCFSKL